MTEDTKHAHSLLDDMDIPDKGPYGMLTIDDRVVALIARYTAIRTARDTWAKHHDEVLEMIEAKAEQLMVDVRRYRKP